jgi:Trm5-related predicted tRNA methylase
VTKELKKGKGVEKAMMTTEEVLDVMLRLYQELAAMCADEQIPLVLNFLEEARASLTEVVDFLDSARSSKHAIEKLEKCLLINH